jgi:rod shape-determining protein MreD
VRSFLLAAALVVVLPVIQVVVVNRLSLPGLGPDLVLAGVTAFALASRPTSGAVLGFAAGLAADLAPPADHSIGRHALVMCLAGWFCGRVPAEGTAGLRAGTAALAALGATLLDAALALVLGDEAAHHVLGGLPGALAWTVPCAVAAAVALSLLPRRRFGRAPSVSRAALRSPHIRGRHA